MLSPGAMDQLSLGFFAGSRKENERRLPIHPRHLRDVDADARTRIFLEHGYGERFGIDDGDLAPLVGGVRSREQLMESATSWSCRSRWPRTSPRCPRAGPLGLAHCVQDEEITQLAIDRRLTLIAWEAMNLWSSRRLV